MVYRIFFIVRDSSFSAVFVVPRHIFSNDRNPFLIIITEYCAAGDLDKFVDRMSFNPTIPEELVIAWLAQTASALDVSSVLFK